MSSALRVSIILVLLLATTAFGLIAYNMNQPKSMPVAVAEAGPAPTTVGYFVAVHALPRGTLAREEDFTVRTVPPERVPTGAILETPDSKVALPGSLVRKFVEAGSPITPQDILRPRDRGFLATVLAPDSRAISIKVDEESGVSGLIRPGDHVDVVLTQVFEKADPARRALSETVLQNARVIAIDQEIVQGGTIRGQRAGQAGANGVARADARPGQESHGCKADRNALAVGESGNRSMGNGGQYRHVELRCLARTGPSERARRSENCCSGPYGR